MSHKNVSWSIFILVGGIALAGCREPHPAFQPIILDSTDILSKETEEWLQDFPFPPGASLLVETEDKVEASRIAVTANEKFSALAEKQPDHSTKTAIQQIGVYVLVTKEPLLIQVRVGKELYYRALMNGTLAGSEYLRLQQGIPDIGLDEATRQAVQRIAQALDKDQEVPWYEKAAWNYIQGFIGSELSALSLPGDSYYGIYLVTPIAKVRWFEWAIFRSWWLTLICVSIIVHITKYVAGALVDRRRANMGRSTFDGLYNIGIHIMAIVVSLLLSIPAAASLVLLSAARMEDNITMKATGFEGVDQLSLAADLFQQRTTIPIVLLVFALRFFSHILPRISLLRRAILPEERQRQDYANLGAFDAGLLMGTIARKKILFGDKAVAAFEKAPYREVYSFLAGETLAKAISWAVLSWLFLPKVLSLTAIWLWVYPTIIGLLDSIKSFRQGEKFLQPREATDKTNSPAFRVGLAVILLTVAALLMLADTVTCFTALISATLMYLAFFTVRMGLALGAMTLLGTAIIASGFTGWLFLGIFGLRVGVAIALVSVSYWTFGD